MRRKLQNPRTQQSNVRSLINFQPIQQINETPPQFVGRININQYVQQYIFLKGLGLWVSGEMCSLKGRKHCVEKDLPLEWWGTIPGGAFSGCNPLSHFHSMPLGWGGWECIQRRQTETKLFSALPAAGRMNHILVVCCEFVRSDFVRLVCGCHKPLQWHGEDWDCRLTWSQRAGICVCLWANLMPLNLNFPIHRMDT